MTTRPRYFTPGEVSSHNTAEDCWVSYLGHVYDLSPLLAEHSGSVLLKPLLANAGRDISHWFDPTTQDAARCPTLQWGESCMSLHLAPDPIGGMTLANHGGKMRTTLLVSSRKKQEESDLSNTLTLQEQTIEVCSEEILQEILKRYSTYNSHAASYTWKYYGRCLDMSKTLEENGITEESKEFYLLKIDEDDYLPAINLYFNDDLTET